MKRFLSLLLTAVLLAGCFVFVSNAAESILTVGAFEEEDGPGSAAYMANLDKQKYKALGSYEEIKSITNLSGKYYLTADITIPEDNEEIVLDGFSGIFDGNGHTIYNSRITVFDNLSGTVKNVTFSDCTDETETDTFTVECGIIKNDDGEKNYVGYAALFGNELKPGAVIENVVSDRQFAIPANYFGAFARGIAADAEVQFINCVNNSNISSPYPANNSKIGGFVGIVEKNSTVTFRNCVNNGNQEGSQVGGFIGVINGGDSITFEACINSGRIAGVIGKGSTGDASYGVSGGFIGSYNNTYGLNGNIAVFMEDCVNTGDVVRVDKNSTAVHKDNKVASGGLIGNLGSATDKFGFNIEIKNCAIHGCTIGGKTKWKDLINKETDEVAIDYTQGYAGSIIGWIGNHKGNNDIVIENVYVSDIEVLTADPDYASALINFASDTDAVDMKEVYVMNSTYTSVGTGAFTITNNGTDDNLRVQKAQTSAPEDGAVKVRFLGGLDTLNYSSVGYMVEKTVDGKSEYFFLDTRTVYEAVNNGDGQLTKADFGDRYIVAIPLADLATDETIGLKVTPLAVTEEGGLLVGVTKSITLTNGALS